MDDLWEEIELEEEEEQTEDEKSQEGTQAAGKSSVRSSEGRGSDEDGSRSSSHEATSLGERRAYNGNGDDAAKSVKHLDPDHDRYGQEEVEEVEHKAEHEELWVRVVANKGRTGLEPHQELEPEEGEVLAGRYRVVGLLGEAAFSQGFECEDLQEGKNVCVKILGSKKEWLDQGLDEARLLRLTNSHDPQGRRGIVQLHDVLYAREHLMLCTQLLGKSLYDLACEDGAPVRTLTDALCLTSRLMDALSFLHGLGIVHCDLKPENVLLPPPTTSGEIALDSVRIIDLGGACFYETDRLSSYVQSRPYRAPEVVKGLPYGAGVDIWSAGCVLYEAIANEVLFDCSSHAELLAGIHSLLGYECDDPNAHNACLHPKLCQGSSGDSLHTSSGLPWLYSERLDKSVALVPRRVPLEERLARMEVAHADQLADFVRPFLVVDPEERPSADEILALLARKS